MEEQGKDYGEDLEYATFALKPYPAEKDEKK